MPEAKYAPTFRLQDELHLLRDALGAVDAHYEALIDHLQHETTGTAAKILGSSATLSGYQHQVDVLYRGQAESFLFKDHPLRRDFDGGIWVKSLDPRRACTAGSTPSSPTIESSLSCSQRSDGSFPTLMGHVPKSVYRLKRHLCCSASTARTWCTGNTIRDLDAAARSLETQVPVEGDLNTATLTGHTPFDEVRCGARQTPGARAGVRRTRTRHYGLVDDVSWSRRRPAEFDGGTRPTAHHSGVHPNYGPCRPNLAGRGLRSAQNGEERDASTFRSWEQFVTQGDRFVESVPITNRSTRVLEQTMPGLFSARLLHVHEPQSSIMLTTVKNLKKFSNRDSFDSETEIEAVIELLNAHDDLSEGIRKEVRRWVEDYLISLKSRRRMPVSPLSFPLTADGRCSHPRR